MSSETAWSGRSRRRLGRARVAPGQRRGWARAGALLLLTCACGGSDGKPSTPPDATPIAPAPVSPPTGGGAPSPDAGAVEAPSPADAIPLSPQESAPANDAPARIDPEEACSSGQTEVCLDTTRVVLCQGGQPIETTCNKLCDNFGRSTGPCDDGCQCGEPSNATCVQASEDFCACTSLVTQEACAPETQDRLYLACHVNGIGGALMKCTAAFRATRPDAAVDAAFCTDLDDACD